jgi:hypothetical protein
VKRAFHGYDQTDSVVLVRKRTIPTERPPLISEVDTLCSKLGTTGKRRGGERETDLLGLQSCVVFLGM